MSTTEKLERYEFAMRDWHWRMKACASDPFHPRAPLEPIASQFGLGEGVDIWAAAQVRARVMAGTPSQTKSSAG